jgi:SulP family sulfate permease
LLFPNVPLTLETLQIILPTSIAVAAVGLLESLLTASIVDGMTDTKSDKNRESIGQGIANIASGFFGGMGGCAMIGQTMINVKVSGARTRISTFLAGLFLLILVVGLGDVVALIPMAALVAVMIMVSVGTFRWASLRNLRTHPRASSVVMLATVVGVVATHNLAIGVLTGVLLSGVFFAGKVARMLRVTSTLSEDGSTRTYLVEGQLFFASADDFAAAIDTRPGDLGNVPGRVVIDVGRAHIWDISSVAALDAVVLKLRRAGAEVTLVGLNAASETIIDRLAVHDKPGAPERATGH